MGKSRFQFRRKLSQLVQNVRVSKTKKNDQVLKSHSIKSKTKQRYSKRKAWMGLAIAVWLSSGVPKLASADYSFNGNNSPQLESVLKNKVRGGGGWSDDSPVFDDDGYNYDSSDDNTCDSNNFEEDTLINLLSLQNYYTLKSKPLQEDSTRSLVPSVIFNRNRVPKLQPMSNLQDWEDFDSELMKQIKKSLRRNIDFQNEFRENSNTSKLRDEMLEFLVRRLTHRAVKISLQKMEQVIDTTSYAAMELFVDHMFAKTGNHNYSSLFRKLEDQRTTRLKESMLQKAFYKSLNPPTVNTGGPKSVRSTEESLGTNLLVFDAYLDTFGTSRPYVIANQQTGDKWYHFTNYPELKKPDWLPSSITDPEMQLTKSQKRIYRKQLDSNYINTMRRAIKAFCLNEETEILYPGTFYKNAHEDAIKEGRKGKDIPTMYKGTFFINRKKRQFVFFKEPHNRYHSGWICRDNQKGEEEWNDLINNHNML